MCPYDNFTENTIDYPNYYMIIVIPDYHYDKNHMILIIVIIYKNANSQV